ncbi:MAG: PTS sugar transporter subunit IIA, partial [Corynebacterium casei]
MSQLNTLLASEAVDLNARATDWRDAISRAGKLLETSGAITADYTAAMISSVEENGP